MGAPRGHILNELSPLSLVLCYLSASNSVQNFVGAVSIPEASSRGPGAPTMRYSGVSSETLWMAPQDNPQVIWDWGPKGNCVSSVHGTGAQAAVKFRIKGK